MIIMSNASGEENSFHARQLTTKLIVRKLFVFFKVIFSIRRDGAIFIHRDQRTMNSFDFLTLISLFVIKVM